MGMKKRFWAPNALKKDYQIDKTFKGIYVPYWTYDTQTYSSYNGQAGHYYYVTQRYTVMVDGKPQARTRQVQKIRWFPVSGNHNKFFDDVLVNDSANIDQNIIAAIQPFNLQALTLYDAKYLAGFAAEKYKSGVKSIWEKAKNMISQRIQNDIRVIILRSADVVGTLNIHTDYQDVTYKHMLLPVWISAYHFRGKLYNFYINGQTGEVQGKSPVSVFKVIIAILIAAVVFGLIAMWLSSGSSAGYMG